MADLYAGLDAGAAAGPEDGDDPATGVSALFRARYPELVRQGRAPHTRYR